MIIDFKEIPPSNKGGGQQDRFEQFSCDFLESIGYKIIRRPDRGPDGKKDLIVSDIRTGVGGQTTIKWLVSCKHNAHSGNAVTDTDEEDILDRVEKHQCDGFLGFYSTIPSSSLSDKLYALQNKVECNSYDSTRIEKELLSSNHKDRLLASYFPNSHDKYRKQLFQEAKPETIGDSSVVSLTEDDVFRICKTAIVILETEKIKEEYFDATWDKRGDVLGKLYKYADHSNESIAREIFQFLYSAIGQTRGGMPPGIASSIQGLVVTFFPSSYEREEKERYENGRMCVHIGFGLVYDAFIYLRNFEIAAWGLSILKYVYREAKRNGVNSLIQEVLSEYKRLEQTLNRQERKDLGYAQEFVKVFKDDLEDPDLAWPILPKHLYSLLNESRKEKQPPTGVQIKTGAKVVN